MKKLSGKQGFIDLFWKGTLLVAHKSRGKDLDRAYQQAIDYFPGLQNYELPSTSSSPTSPASASTPRRAASRTTSRWRSCTSTCTASPSSPATRSTSTPPKPPPPSPPS
ncbi:type IIL restriction-modification enzyme MmeI [Hymenobacter busanensis]|uniref:type IIL restriction-modification enzyme MmeI n=1 Tax=Hymenobacter busanensis TaxID=2607656 RepID=UPI003B847DBC